MTQEQAIEDQGDTVPVGTIIGVPALRAEAYWDYLEGLDLSDPDKAALLNTLWAMMVGFVDLGFGVDPVQQILPALVHGALESAGDTLEENQTHSRFNTAAGGEE